MLVVEYESFTGSENKFIDLLLCIILCNDYHLHFPGFLRFPSIQKKTNVQICPQVHFCLSHPSRDRTVKSSESNIVSLITSQAWLYLRSRIIESSLDQRHPDPGR